MNTIQIYLRKKHPGWDTYIADYGQYRDTEPIRNAGRRTDQGRPRITTKQSRIAHRHPFANIRSHDLRDADNLINLVHEPWAFQAVLALAFGTEEIFSKANEVASTEAAASEIVLLCFSLFLT